MIPPKDTAEQKAEIKYRQEHGYPLHSPPHPYRESGYYFLTAAIYQHQAVMASPDRRGEFERELLSSLAAIQVETAAWVILPDHYHILLGVETLEAVSGTLKQLHGTSSRRWNQEDGMTGQRKVWYHFYDRAIRNEHQHYGAINYIHINPLKHQLVDDIYDCTWSSLQIYLDTFGKKWLRDIWSAHHPDQGMEMQHYAVRDD